MKKILLILCGLCVLCGGLPAQTKKILAAPDTIKELGNPHPQARLVAVTKENMMKEIADADAVIGTITPEMVRAGKNLKWVQVMSAGVENVLFKSGSNDLRDSNIILTNNQIVQGPEIADHAMAMLLYFTRSLNVYNAAKQKEAWGGGRFPGIELMGRNGLVIGCGGIGMQISMRAWAHGMNVTCVDPDDLPYSPFVKTVVKPDMLDSVLPEADVVFISAPHTPMSNKMMGPSQFEKMKKGSYFIAVSRGGIYDLNALVKALDDKRLTGAGVDVMDPEPLPKGHPLWKFENVVITPHIAGRSDKDRARMIGTIQDNIRRFAEGKPLINVVDKHKGY